MTKTTKGRRVGYARVSTTDQNLEIQQAALEKAGCDLIMEEKISGTKREGREQLEIAIKVLNKGDTLVVTRLDRLGRSMRDLANLVHEIENKGANLHVIEQSVDTSTTAGRAFFGMLAVFAQFETDVRRERQAEGIAKAKAAGLYKGREAAIDPEAIKEKLALGISKAEAARQLGISRQSIYRLTADTDTE